MLDVVRDGNDGTVDQRDDGSWRRMLSGIIAQLAV
jgi:hypothetical protein